MKILDPDTNHLPEPADDKFRDYSTPPVGIGCKPFGKGARNIVCTSVQ
jgi:hypothetical protein